MRLPVSREIGGLRFTVAPLGFRTQASLFVLLTKALGPALIETLAGAKSLADLTDASKFDLRAIATKAIEGLSDDLIDRLIEALGSSTSVQITPARAPNLDSLDAREEAFGAGRLDRFFGWIAFACEVNFGPFFGSLAQRVREQESTANTKA